jgi:hypothetical protein
MKLTVARVALQRVLRSQEGSAGGAHILLGDDAIGAAGADVHRAVQQPVVPRHIQRLRLAVVLPVVSRTHLRVSSYSPSWTCVPGRAAEPSKPCCELEASNNAAQTAGHGIMGRTCMLYMTSGLAWCGITARSRVSTPNHTHLFSAAEP